MSNIIKVNTSELRKVIPTLKAGDKILLTGTVYTSRDAAHKRINNLLDENKPLPFDLKDAIIYYAGPTPAPEGKAIGSCGPTTSSRMDKFAPRFLDYGLCAMVGKGERNQAVRDAIIRNKAIYLCAIGGAGALASHCITSCEVIAFEDLGCESVKKLTFQDFPLIVANDCFGGDIFSIGRNEYRIN
ncbi:MAG: Fe-S-containing hydro-lyase [Oscillospiraceae bacterium]